ncbi:hypothetical protein JTB14_036908 [Gonioctena quinquepunctata]|nr:hypothetical protein JTB14_036908 [Gonioctena quinquepunctata]
MMPRDHLSDHLCSLLRIKNFLNHWVIMSLPKGVFDMYRRPKFDESIQRLETRTHYPYVKSFGNNDIIEIPIQQSEAWLLMYDAVITIKGTLVTFLSPALPPRPHGD